MADNSNPVDLYFARPAGEQGNPVDLVFGDEGGSAAPEYVVHVAGSISSLSGYFGARTGVQAYVAGSVSGMSGHVGVGWDANVSRGGVRQELSATWQAGTSVAAANSSSWQRSQQINSGLSGRWQQQGAPARAALAQAWQQAEGLRSAFKPHWQQGVSARAGLAQAWQQAERLRGAFQQRWQQAEMRRAAAQQYSQQALQLRAATEQHWQEAAHVFRAHASGYGPGQPISIARRHHWQEAMRPPPGVSTVKPPTGHVCWSADLPAELVFDEPWGADLPAHLVFACRKGGSVDPEPGDTLIVPVQRAYIVLNSIELLRVSDGAVIPANAFSMSLDVNSWTWSWQATVPGRALELVRSVDGEATEVLAVINDVPYRLIVEDFPRERSFGSDWISVSGRGRSAELDQPGMPERNHGNAIGMSAQQLALQVLTLNGASIGWEIDWQLTDWQVPANAWTLQGGYMDALTDIAGAVGGYVQPHRTDRIIRILPRYPVQPWLWSSLVPNYELPSDAVQVESTAFVRNPPYNRVNVWGEGEGVWGEVVRAGTLGDFDAPMIVHPLITDVEAVRQRGIAELGRSGRSQSITLNMQVLPQTGVIHPGSTVRYVDGGINRLGLVRSSALSWDGAASLRQRIELEVPEQAL